MADSETEDISLRIVFGEPVHMAKSRSSVPEDITGSMLKNEKLPAELPALGSSIVEDFILDKIKAGTTKPEDIANAFFDEEMPQKIDSLITEVQRVSDSLNWQEIFTQEDADKTKQAVLAEMQSMGMTEDQIAQIREVEVRIGEGVGVSGRSDTVAYASRLQAVRKALDYEKVFGSDIPIARVIRSIMTSRVGHELGHSVDNVADNPSDEMSAGWIPTDHETEHETDNRMERFAEAWGRIVLTEDDLQTATQREWVLQVAKVNQVWTTLRNAAEPIDLFAIFEGIESRIADSDSHVKHLIYARKALYGRNEPEHYALPYSRDEVQRAIMRTSH